MNKILVIVIILILVLTSCQPAVQKADVAATPVPPIRTESPPPTKMVVVANNSSITPQPTLKTLNYCANKVEFDCDCDNVIPALSDQDAIRYQIYCFDSKWIDYVNEDEDDVFDYIQINSPAYKIAKNFNKSNISEKFIGLEVYSVYVDGSSGYAAVYEKIKKNSKDKTYKWVYRLVKDNGIWKIHSFNSTVPKELFEKLVKYAKKEYKQEFNNLADIISTIWMVNEKTPFNTGGYIKDLAYIRLGEAIEEYSEIEKLQPQDGAQTHIKDSWWLDIASMYTLVEEYDKATDVYDAIIKFNDCNVIGACIGKAEIYRRKNDYKNMKKWLDKAKLASDNNDMLP